MLVLRNTVDLKTRHIIYHAYLYSALQKGTEFWGFASDIAKVFNIQKMF